MEASLRDAMIARRSHMSKLNDMANQQFTGLAEEISRRIGSRLKECGKTHEELGMAIGIRRNAVTRITSRQGCLQYAKLVRLSSVLETTPNELLGVERKREAFRGAVIGIIEAFGRSSVQAQEIAALVLTVLDTPPIGQGDPAERARIIVQFLVAEYLNCFCRLPAQPEPPAADGIGPTKSR
jgi:hypothetical protein